MKKYLLIIKNGYYMHCEFYYSYGTLLNEINNIHMFDKNVITKFYRVDNLVKDSSKIIRILKNVNKFIVNNRSDYYGK